MRDDPLLDHIASMTAIAVNFIAATASVGIFGAFLIVVFGG
jgi:hypothetical protein